MIEKEEILKIARLSNFELDEKDIEKFTYELRNIVKILNRLDQINTDGIEPMYSSLDFSNVFRKDLQKNSEINEEIIELSEYSQGNLIIIPKVVG